MTKKYNQGIFTNPALKIICDYQQKYVRLGDISLKNFGEKNLKVIEGCVRKILAEKEGYDLDALDLKIVDILLDNIKKESVKKSTVPDLYLPIFRPEDYFKDGEAVYVSIIEKGLYGSNNTHHGYLKCIVKNKEGRYFSYERDQELCKGLGFSGQLKFDTETASYGFHTASYRVLKISEFETLKKAKEGHPDFFKLYCMNASLPRGLDEMVLKDLSKDNKVVHI